jgi:hypothetical protein
MGRADLPTATPLAKAPASACVALLQDIAVPLTITVDLEIAPLVIVPVILPV